VLPVVTVTPKFEETVEPQALEAVTVIFPLPVDAAGCIVIVLVPWPERIVPTEEGTDHIKEVVPVVLTE
jgi:hypothetical protein